MFVWTIQDAIGVAALALCLLLLLIGGIAHLITRACRAAKRGVRRLFDFFPPTWNYLHG